MSIVTKIAVLLIGLPLMGFSVFGFLASFEPGAHMGFKIGYAILFFMLLLGMGWTLLQKSTAQS